MGDKGLVVNGFLFSTNKEYNQAKEELEAIEYIKKNTDLTNAKTVLKLYTKLTGNRTFHTPVGYTFLSELRDTIIQSGIIKPEIVENIYIPSNVVDNNEVAVLKAEQYKVMAEKERTKHRNSRIINIFLVFIIMAMIVIAIYTDKNLFTNFETSIIDKYSAWEEELDKREQALDELEEQLNGDNKNAR